MDAILHQNSIKQSQLVEGEHSSDSDGERNIKDALAYYKESLNPRNALNYMYQNDSFMALKAQMENEVIENTKQEVERKYMLQDCDRVLEEHNKWKEEQKKRKEAEKEKQEERDRFRQEYEQKREMDRIREVE